MMKFPKIKLPEIGWFKKKPKIEAPMKPVTPEEQTKQNRQEEIEKIKKEMKTKKKFSFFKKEEIMSKKGKKPKIIVKRRRFLKTYLKKAGYDYVDDKKFKIQLIYILAGIFILASVIVFIMAIISEKAASSLLFILGLWTGVFPLVLIVTWVLIYTYLDFRVYRRKQAIEEVWPEFLQLTAANINAGMTIDRALWYALRPKFGILAKEIEEVAKATMTGEDLGKALTNFTEKYDSVILARSVNLLLEGLEAGGEVAELLNKISIDIQETRILKKEMAANVTTYVIFIGFASIIAAPFLFALSSQLLSVIQKIMGGIMTTESTGFSLAFNANSVKQSDFRLFAILMLLISSMFSAFIISTIQKGSIKDGLKYIPIFMVSSVFIYFISLLIVGAFMSTMI